MLLPDRQMHELIEESQDLHTDAMRTMRDNQSAIVELSMDRRGKNSDLDRINQFTMGRRALLQRLGIGAVGVVGMSAAFATILTPKAKAADGDIDVQILQTASSLEILAIATYAAALKLPFIKNGNKVIVAFAETTMSQHSDHNQAFQKLTEGLGGTVRTKPSEKYLAVVEKTKPMLKGPADVVKLAATLEQVATETYLNDLNMFTDKEALGVMASVMGVECQHLATLRAVGALLAGGAPELIAIPTKVAQLPAAAGAVAFPLAFQGTGLASPPEEGAIG